ncbi:TRL-like family protein [Desulfatitalea alkaliphila]|uniref:TRL-like family protein n=1 Tax=Desulfatitalea alkaliphila TaxID=2929485 RepID=A0AA41R504_9BACT|nr:TRL-like family protein [Desulfatitalea alkaliphila]MCJ8501618.1 TRL-like family protein [Desulfatitalea alkaliphila]
MKRYFRMLAVVVLVFAVSGCAYVHTKTPLDTNLHETELGTKIGTAQAHSIAWLVAWGDASYAAAARNGNITVLRHADQESFQVFFGFYTRFRVIVYGD